MLGPGEQPLDLDAVGDRVAEAIAAVYRGDAESDPLNRLVITAGLDRPQVAILRAYRKYRQRIGSRFTESYQNDVLAANSPITAKLVRYFELRFDPDVEPDEAAESALRDEILADLEEVTSIDHDRILRNQLGAIDATLRTNAYKADRGATAFKLRSADVPAMPHAGAGVRDLRLRRRRGGHPPARRRDRARRHPLLGPHGLPHRGLRPDARAADQERDHRAGGRQGRLHRQARADRQGGDRGVLRHLHPVAAGRHRQPGRRRGRAARAACGCATRTTPTSSSPPTRARRRSPTPPTRSPPSTASGSTTRSPPAARSATTTRSSGSPRAARGSRSSATSASSGSDPARDEFTVVGIGDMSGDVFGNGMLLSDKIRLLARLRPPARLHRPGPGPGGVVRRAQAAVRAAGLVVGRLRRAR